MVIPISLHPLWQDLTLQDYLRSFYLLAAASILLANSIPPLSSRFFTYGKTAQSPKTSSSSEKIDDDKPNHPATTKPLTSLLDTLTTLTVPHSYFTHFYLLSVVSLVFWYSQLLFNGSLLRHLLSLGPSPPEPPPFTSLTNLQFCLTYICLLAQSYRRLYEQTYLSPPSTSKMLLPHYLLGHAFYLTITLSIFSSLSIPFSLNYLTTPLPTTWGKVLLSLPLFLYSSYLQHQTHIYFYSLPKYTLPPLTHPLFRYVLSPHYLFEILIYLSLAILSAPQGKLVNQTIMCAVVFVAVNLGVSAGRTWAWYKARFGDVGGRKKIIPWVY